MFNKILIAVAAVAFISIAAIVIFNAAMPNTAQATTTALQASTATGSDAGISVSGTGKASAKPNIATAVVGIQVTTSTLAEATSQANSKMAAIIDKVKSMGVADKDMQTINYSVSPVMQTRQNETPRITGYTVSNQLRITVRKIDDLGKILDSAVAAGANNIYGVTFSIDDPKPLLAQARADAVKDAQDKASQLAKAGGLTLGKIITIHEGTVSPQPVFRAASAMAVDSSAVPVQTGEMEITVNVEIRFAVQ